MENSCHAGVEGTHPLDLAARLVGCRSSLADLLGVSSAAIGNWKKRGVPFEQCIHVERATKGYVTRQMLRPADWNVHWPELAKAQPIIAPAATENVAESGV